jgi:hypothetical protein
MDNFEERRRYLVTIPIAPAHSPAGRYTLPAPFVIGEKYEIEKGEGCLLVKVKTYADTANDAWENGVATVNELLFILALGYAGFVPRVENDNQRNVKRIGAKYIADGPIPEADMFEGIVTEHGLRELDPTGEKRRAGAVVNVTVEVLATKNNLEFEERALAVTSLWTERQRNALSLFHQAHCSPDIAVSFMLSWSTLEVLAEENEIRLINRLIPEKKERKSTISEIFGFIATKVSDVNAINRFQNQFENTRAESQLSAFERYFTEHHVNVSDLDWFRKQRGKFIHAGGFDRSDEAKTRLREFEEWVRSAILHEIEGLALPSAQ